FRTGVIYSLLGVLLLLAGAGASRFGAGTRLGKRINIFLEAHRLMVAIVVGLLIYGAILTSHASAAVGGSDSAGYAHMARSILDGEITPPIAALSQLDLPESFGPLFISIAFTPGARPKTMTTLY